MNSSLVLQASGISKFYYESIQKKLLILKDINLSVQAGEQIAIMGRSGSGKTTLLQILGGLDVPSAGKIMLNNKDFYSLSENNRNKIRNQDLGFIYQFHHLLPEFTALENIALPLCIAGSKVNIAQQRALELLDAIGLMDRKDHKPQALSGGEKQRVAIARALINNPQCVLADEPTGNLDTENALQVFNLLQKLNSSRKVSFIIVTHDLELAKKMDKIYYLNHGSLSE